MIWFVLGVVVGAVGACKALGHRVSTAPREAMRLWRYRTGRCKCALCAQEDK